MLRALQSRYRVKSVIHGIAHITGGGLRENLQRILPPGVSVKIVRHGWTIPPVFEWLKQLGELDADEMDEVFNMGIGLALVVSPHFADSLRRQIEDHHLECWQLGEVTAGSQTVDWV
jgi:phosphoribosylformylglycinamidine cyclo-ligase